MLILNQIYMYWILERGDNYQESSEYTQTSCEGDEMAIDCNSGKEIHLQEVFYGHNDSDSITVCRLKIWWQNQLYLKTNTKVKGQAKRFYYTYIQSIFLTMVCITSPLSHKSN